MQVALARWGNSLGILIPKDIATRLGLREGERVDIETDGTASSSCRDGSAMRCPICF
jgi:antitoxin component of MazEF toxin-antitoxin module